MNLFFVSVFAINSCHLRRACRPVIQSPAHDGGACCFVFSCPKRPFFLETCFRGSRFSFFIFPRENQLKKKISRIENQRRKRRKLITPANSNSLLSPRTPPPKPWQARTRRQLNHSPRLSCPYIASSPVRHTDLRAGTFAAHIRSRVPQDSVNLLRWGILKTIWRVVWYGGTYNSTGKQPLGLFSCFRSRTAVGCSLNPICRTIAHLVLWNPTRLQSSVKRIAKSPFW